MKTYLKYILLITLLISQLHAIDKSGLVVYNETISSRDNYSSENFQGSTHDDSYVFQTNLKVKYYNFLTDKIFINGMVTARYDNIDEEYKKLINDVSTDKEIYFESLYMSYNIYSDWYITGGIIPFTNGSYSEISELDYQKGTGLIKIIDTPLEALFIMKKGKLLNTDTIFRAGYGIYGCTGIPISSKVDEHSNGTDGYYLTYDMYKNYDSLKFNYYHVDLKYDDNPHGYVNMYSVGFNKYFIKQGINIFGTFGYDENKLNLSNSAVKKKINPMYLYAFPKAFNFEDNVETHGYLYNIGASKDIDSTLVESYNIGISYTYTSDNWYSLTNNSYTDEMNFRFMNGDNIYGWATTKFTRNIALKVFYGIMNNRNAKVIGNSTMSVDFKESPRKFVTRIERYGLKLIFKY